MVVATHEMTISARQTARAAAVDLLPTTIETSVWNFIARYIMFID